MDEEFLDADIGLEYDDENNEEENDDGDIIEDNIDLDLGLENTGDGQGVELGDFNGMNTLSSFTDAGAASAKKRERSNAKAVECLDLDGNLIEVFRSGLAAATKLNIPQGDISLCCRGLKHQVNGYRFRFFGDQQDPSEFKLKRGYRYVLEGTSEQKQETSMRTTRASRGEYAVGHRHTGGDDGDFSIRKRFMEVAHIKPRKWSKTSVNLGSLTIMKWVADIANPTAELQAMKSVLEEPKKVRGSGRKKHTVSFAGTARTRALNAAAAAAASMTDYVT